MRANFFKLLLWCTVLYACNNEESIRQITYSEFQLLDQNEVLIVDVRSASEFNSGHVPNAINIGFGTPTFSEDIQALDKNKSVVVYCSVGSRSYLAAGQFAKSGFKGVYQLKDGFEDWLTQKQIEDAPDKLFSSSQ